VIGSEKEDFFRDPRVIEALSARRLTVSVEKAGSRQIATLPNLERYDFAFPAGLPAAEKIGRERRALASYTPFFTPMVIASWQSIAQVLVANNLARQAEGHYFLNMKKLIELMNAGQRWRDLADNPDYAVSKNILISSTDARKSNSAAMYLALFSFVANGEEVVRDESQRGRAGREPDLQNLPGLSRCFSATGLHRVLLRSALRGLSGDGCRQGSASDDLRIAISTTGGARRLAPGDGAALPGTDRLHQACAGRLH